ncbi:hypothetical protein SAMN04489711_1472 [Paracidovorax wautersii]|uniref:Uncharacterized protein n=2 Tax=Paracidovorax wautersii TaxID=1177982 RepID=A0A1I2HZE4_9BURK|nr:hypothetical protein SAMN04489711_1472 [Paracidovorax wautersii]
MGMATPYPEASPEQSPHLSAFGFPMPMKRLHKALTAALNRVPLIDQNNTPLREPLLDLIKRGVTDDELFEEITSRLGEATAREDIMQKRITQMTPVDFISNQAYATPTESAVKAMKRQVLEPQHKRFAEMPVKEGRATNEWSMIDLDTDGPSF